MSANSDFITVETYVHTGKQLKTSCSYMGQHVFIFGYLQGPGGGGGGFSYRAYFAVHLSSHPYICPCEIRKQSIKFKSKI